jgi:hypothetical protein
LLNSGNRNWFIRAGAIVVDDRLAVRQWRGRNTFNFFSFQTMNASDKIALGNLLLTEIVEQMDL